MALSPSGPCTSTTMALTVEATLWEQRSWELPSILVMWLLAVDHLQRFVIAHKLTEFNAAMLARTEYRNTSPIGGQDDFSELRKEKHFVELLGSARIVSHDMKKLLEEKLDFRNTCAHPNTIFVSDTKVVSFVEDLVHNVILRLRL